ncbi:hypothetical protein H8B06_14260 [Sphingobacterium sp. DN00404]|uniref:Uncharacterized protein n=1 Tax=Sphingobacterium micropteri TaxID=2763501 RepID=A0ABR7YRM9_9SPHI|nr:DUF6686 family protein [Sphingobacterium micropteri]MBD1433998.1 hypothetical protein [Sphingobacterium micropteri]
MCHIRTLSQVGETLVTQAACCGVIHIWHNNLILRLGITGLRNFSKFLNGILFEADCVEFPGGEWKVIIDTPSPEIRFALGQNEFSDFRDAMEQALLMHEVYVIMEN